MKSRKKDSNRTAKNRVGIGSHCDKPRNPDRQKVKDWAMEIRQRRAGANQ